MTSELERREQVKALALALGFDLAGVAEARVTPETRFLREWIARGYAGSMAYLERRLEERVDPRQLLPGAKSFIVVGLVYDRDAHPAASAGPSRPGGDEAETARAQVARYAGGDDYHGLMTDRLEALLSGVEALVGHAIKGRVYVDTGPVLERVFAAHAGLGWIGKNTCLIHPRLGSYVFLGVVLTDLSLSADTPVTDHCGSCRACLDACPTQAFERAYVLNATRCISYTTIEAPGAIPEELREAHGDHLFGCDICQEVCPWNHGRSRELPPDPLGLRERLRQRSEWVRPSLAWVLGLDEDAWRAVTQRTALRRAKYRGLLRNALVAAGNSGDSGLRPLLERHAEGPDSLLADHARWALARLPSSARAASA
ncbi:MAG: tRNA epoxyqueuosine(34) reductase QueG [Myxococcota bacterium]